MAQAPDPFQAKNDAISTRPPKSTLNTWLLATWAFPPNPQYLKKQEPFSAAGCTNADLEPTCLSSFLRFLERSINKGALGTQQQ